MRLRSNTPLATPHPHVHPSRCVVSVSCVVHVSLTGDMVWGVWCGSSQPKMLSLKQIEQGTPPLPCPLLLRSFPHALSFFANPLLSFSSSAQPSARAWARTCRPLCGARS